MIVTFLLKTKLLLHSTDKARISKRVLFAEIQIHQSNSPRVVSHARISVITISAITILCICPSAKIIITTSPSRIIGAIGNVQNFRAFPDCFSDIISNGLLLTGWILFEQIIEHAGSLYMSLSSISSTNISSRNVMIPSRALSVVQSGSHGGTGRGGDTFHCATCGGQKISPSLRSPVSAASTSIRTSTPAATSNTYGNYCPTCGGAPSRSAAERAGAVYFHNAR